MGGARPAHTVPLFPRHAQVLRGGGRQVSRGNEMSMDLVWPKLLGALSILWGGTYLRAAAMGRCWPPMKWAFRVGWDWRHPPRTPELVGRERLLAVLAGVGHVLLGVLFLFLDFTPR